MGHSQRRSVAGGIEAMASDPVPVLAEDDVPAIERILAGGGRGEASLRHAGEGDGHESPGELERASVVCRFQL